MPRGKSASSSTRTPTIAKQHIGKTRVHNSTVVQIYPMMPRGYTAAQRAELRKFEKELYGDRRVTVE